MKKKVCSRCKENKNVSLFKANDKYTDGLYSWCMQCKSDYQKNRNIKNPQSKEYSALANKAYSHSKKGVLNSIYYAQKRSPISKKEGLPSYTKEELSVWLFSQDLFHALFDKWVHSGYLKDLKPSIDRKDDYKGYSFDNIQLMTWKKNRTKHHKDRKNGVNNKASRPVNKLNKDGVFIKAYPSMCSAARDVNGDATSIKNCCDKKVSFFTAYGYKWEYKKQKV